MSASAARSNSVTMSVAVDLVVDVDEALRPARQDQRAGLVGQAAAEGEQARRATRRAATPASVAVPCDADDRLRRPPVGHRHQADRRPCAGRWPRPRSATTAAARTPRSTSSRPTFAARLGKEAAVFVPSGTMAQPDRAAAARACRAPRWSPARSQHVVAYEHGAAGGERRRSSSHLVDDADGLLDLAAARWAVRRRRAPRVPVSARVRREHPHGGRRRAVGPRRPSTRSPALGLPVHLDGARLFNAEVATGVERRGATPRAPTTVMCCLSKGLGAPVGLAARRAGRRHGAGPRERKRLGGAMRQAGVLAAPGLVALRDNVERLADDHARARRLGRGGRRALARRRRSRARCGPTSSCCDRPAPPRVARPPRGRGRAGRHARARPPAARHPPRRRRRRHRPRLSGARLGALTARRADRRSTGGSDQRRRPGLWRLPELAPLAHGPQHEHGDDGRAGGGERRAPTTAPMAGADRAVARALEVDEAVADQAAGEAADDDGDEGEGPGRGRRQRRQRAVGDVVGHDGDPGP